MRKLLMSAAALALVAALPQHALADDEALTLLASWNLVLAHKLTVLAAILACLLAAVAFTMLQTPTYRAHTAIEVTLRNEHFLNLREIDSTFSGVTAERYLQTQIQIQVQSQI